MRLVWCVVVVALLSTTACSSSDGCTGARTENLDPTSLTHVLPGAPEPQYLSDPPTSGPHQLGATLTGVRSTPIARPVQVSLLEQGYVLVQYRDVSDAERSELERLASDLVVVAPNPELPRKIVATAWRTSQACAGLDTGALQTFITDHQGKGPGADA